MASTDSEDRILKTARTRLLTFVPHAHPVLGAATLATRLGSTPSGAGATGKLYIDQSPDPGAYPYGIMRWPPSGLTGGDDGGYNIRRVIELQLYGYPRSSAGSISAMLDVVEQAWRDWCVLVVNDSIVAQRAYGRGIVPYEAPADRELVCGRILLPLYSTPQYKAGAA